MKRFLNLWSRVDEPLYESIVGITVTPWRLVILLVFVISLVVTSLGSDAEAQQPPGPYSDSFQEKEVQIPADSVFRSDVYPVYYGPALADPIVTFASAHPDQFRDMFIATIISISVVSIFLLAFLIAFSMAMLRGFGAAVRVYGQLFVNIVRWFRRRPVAEPAAPPASSPEPAES